MGFRKATSRLALAAGFFVGTTSLSQADVPDVVVSIKPLHSLVAGVMEGVGTPTLLMEGASSPHSFSMKPSQARALEQADKVFWVGKEIETFLIKPMDSIVGEGKSVALINSEGIRQLPFREGATFEAHDHGDHGDHGHDDHAHGHDKHDHGDHAHGHDHDKHDHDDHAHGHDHDKHDHDDHAHGHDHDKHDHDDHGHKDHHDHAHDDHDHGHKDHDDHAHDDHGHGHDHGGIDGHIWLDPENAKAIVAEVAKVLSTADADNAETYRTNAQNVQARLDDLLVETATTLDGLAGRPFVVFHDAYQYFETRFGLEAVGAITLNPEITPGADRLSEIRSKVTSLEAACVFAEPQFEPALVDVVIEGTSAKSGVIDPLGARVEAGPDQYFNLIRNMAGSIRSCLTKTS